MTWPRFRNGAIMGAAVVAALFFAILAVLSPRAAAGGWLMAFLFWGGISIGSITALMIHHLTGGRWGEVYAPTLWPAAAAIALFALFLIPVLALLPIFYPWVGDPSTVKADVGAYYLAVPWFIARSVIAFVGWSLIVLALARCDLPRATLAAALGLIFQALIVSFVGLDWIQSIEPPFFSTSFGATLVITQLMSALAWAAVLTPRCERDGAAADLGGLLLAMALGLTYLDFMTYLVIWYGDLPHKNEFFLRRQTLPWLVTVAAAFALTMVIPVFALFLSRVRANASALRVVGVIALVGIALQYTWLIAPAFGLTALAAAALAAIFMGALVVLLMLTPSWSPLLWRKRPSHVE